MGSAGLDHPRLSQPQSAARAGADAPPFGARTGAFGDAAACPGRTAVRCGRPYHAAAGDRAGGGRGGRGEPASRAQAESDAARATKIAERRLCAALARTAGCAESDRACHAQRRRAADERDRARRRPDRKSTRLNSSHSQISYAVFCLKKKKKKNIL